MVEMAADRFGDPDAMVGRGVPGRSACPERQCTHFVDERATIQKGDMRELPFESASFDAAVSSYAIDHLGRDGSKQVLAEAARVVKPGGDFLLMVVAADPWAKFTFGPLLMHGFRGAAWWRAGVEEAGFEVLDQGLRPTTFFILARRL